MYFYGTGRRVKTRARSAGAQERRSAGAQERRSAGAQERRSAGAQERRSAGAQECRNAGTQKRRNDDNRRTRIGCCLSPAYCRRWHRFFFSKTLQAVLVNARH